jgi:hypothetical protein
LSNDGTLRFIIEEGHPIQIVAGWLLKLKDNKYAISVDILVNKLDGIKNSDLICQYAMADSRFAEIMHTLKAWNCHHFKGP